MKLKFVTNIQNCFNNIYKFIVIILIVNKLIKIISIWWRQCHRSRSHDLQLSSQGRICWNKSGPRLNHCKFYSWSYLWSRKFNAQHAYIQLMEVGGVQDRGCGQVYNDLEFFATQIGLNFNCQNEDFRNYKLILRHSSLALQCKSHLYLLKQLQDCAQWWEF